MAKLNAVQVKNVKPGRHADGKGLYLLVKPAEPEVRRNRIGAKSWVYASRLLAAAAISAWDRSTSFR